MNFEEELVSYIDWLRTNLCELCKEGFCSWHQPGRGYLSNLKSKTVRPDWDEYFLAIAQTVSIRGDCKRRQVGAVLVQSDNHTIFIGYNGTLLPKQKGCLEGGCPRGRLSYEECPAFSDYSNCIAVHAEANALGSCIRNQGEPRGSRVYITTAPCDGCQTLLFNSGVREIIWLQDGVQTSIGNPY